MPYFPMFIDLTDRPCLIVGGGIVALRKVEVLLDFGARITVISPEICESIKTFPQVKCIEALFSNEQLNGYTLVIAATDNSIINHEISVYCKEHNIPVNAVDQKEDCTFIFPSYIRQNELVAAFSSGGKSPLMTQYLKECIRPALTPELGQMTDYLGSIRDFVKDHVNTERARKQVYRELLDIFLENDIIPTEEELEKIIERSQL